MDPKENLDKLVKDLFNEDELGSVVRVHIHIESLLHRIISLKAPNPQHIKKLDLDFDKSVTLALVLGLKDEYAPFLRCLGKLRNDFAHKPNTIISKNVIDNLYNSLTSTFKSELQDAFLRIKNENVWSEELKKFQDLPPLDAFRLYMVVVWAKIQSAVIALEHEVNA